MATERLATGSSSSPSLAVANVRMKRGWLQTQRTAHLRAGNKSVTFLVIHPSAKLEITIIDGEGYVFKTLKSNANTVTATDLP